jgi:hypothetical protein
MCNARSCGNNSFGKCKNINKINLSMPKRRSSFLLFELIWVQCYLHKLKLCVKSL